MVTMPTINSDSTPGPDTPNHARWRLRPVTPDDAAALKAAPLNSRPLDAIRSLLWHTEHASRQKRGYGVVAILDSGTPVGFGQITLWGHTAEISDLAVCDTWRHKGIGRALIWHLLRTARQMGAARAEIGVAAWNQRAMRLYVRLGFRYHHTRQLILEDKPEPVYYLALALA